MIDIGNGNLFDIVDLNDGRILETEEEFKKTYKAGRAALVIDLGYAKYPVLITFLANYPDTPTPFAIHVLIPPTPSEEHEYDLLQKLKTIRGLRSIRSEHTLKKTKKMVDGYLQFITKR